MWESSRKHPFAWTLAILSLFPVMHFTNNHGFWYAAIVSLLSAPVIWRLWADDSISRRLEVWLLFSAMHFVMAYLEWSRPL